VNLNHVRVIRPYDRSTFVLVMADTQETEFVVSERQAKLLRERLPGL
jgi:DNA-binding LytR/AlgR family response regulator